MRKLLISFSILFFALSIFITFRASGIPDYGSRYQDSQQDVVIKEIQPKSVDSISNTTINSQASNEALVKELKDTISSLEEKLSKKDVEIQAGIQAERSKNKEKILTVLGSGTFSPGQITINKYMLNTVKELVPGILELSDYRVVIEGHTDSIPITPAGWKRYMDNMELSFLRAKAVADILVQNGISRDRISVIGYGDSHPLDSNNTQEGRARNRRVEVKLVPENRGF